MPEVGKSFAPAGCGGPEARAGLGGAGAGVWATKGSTSWAGYFEGSVHVNGNLSASGTKPFCDGSHAQVGFASED